MGDGGLDSETVNSGQWSVVSEQWSVISFLFSVLDRGIVVSHPFRDETARRMGHPFFADV